MNQDNVFFQGEGNRWFDRNRAFLADKERPDWPLRVLSMLEGAGELGSFLELGCSNGWRLARLREAYGRDRRYAGVDPSEDALAQGRAEYPDLELHRGLLSRIPLEGGFDLVIVNFVFHWVDRSSLAASIAEADRMVADGGYLLIGDFLPDSPQKRAYHHLPGMPVHTYKQDYPAIFTALGTYGEMVRITYGHGGGSGSLRPVGSDDRAGCSLLRKSLTGRYPEAAA
jgi:SAM-dependent methyltransferase